MMSIKILIIHFLKIVNFEPDAPWGRITERFFLIVMLGVHCGIYKVLMMYQIYHA
jgi:hypothetical protein